jgi:restriction endonuclease Mrr
MLRANGAAMPRERAARAQERANQQVVDAAERRRQEQLAHEAGAAAANEMKAQLEVQVLELRTLLTSVLDRCGYTSWRRARSANGPGTAERSVNVPTCTTLPLTNT